MQILIGCTHIIGSIVTYLLFGYLLMLMGRWEQEKTLREISGLSANTIFSSLLISFWDKGFENCICFTVLFETKRLSSLLVNPEEISYCPVGSLTAFIPISSSCA